MYSVILLNMQTTSNNSLHSLLRGNTCNYGGTKLGRWTAWTALLLHIFWVRLEGVRTKLKRGCSNSNIGERNPWTSRRHFQPLLALLRVSKCFNNACGARFLLVLHRLFKKLYFLSLWCMPHAFLRVDWIFLLLMNFSWPIQIGHFGNSNTSKFHSLVGSRSDYSARNGFI